MNDGSRTDSRVAGEIDVRHQSAAIVYDDVLANRAIRTD
jgi:hypothetical protein